MEKTVFKLAKRLLWGRGAALHETEEIPPQLFFWRILILLVFFYLVLPAGLSIISPGLQKKLADGKVFFLVLVLPQLCLTAALFGVVYFTARHTSMRKKLGMVNWRSNYLQLAVLVCFILLIVNVIVTILMERTFTYFGLDAPHPAIFSLLDNASVLQQIWLVIMVLAVAPVVEELIFRRFIYNYCEACLGVVPGIVVTSAWFAVIHDSYIQWPGLFLLGVVFQLSYIVSRSIYFPITIHFFNNLISVCIYFLWM